MNITLLFTYGVSLKKWDNSGLIDRELLFYRRLADMGYNINFITYGTTSDSDYKEKTQNIKVFPVYKRIKKSAHNSVDFLKSLAIPFRFKDVFVATDIIKTNQMNGSWVGLIAKYLYGKKLVVRCGFEWYRNAYIRRKKRFSLFRNAIAYILEWLVYKFCDEIIMSNESDIQFIKETFNINPKKIHLIRNYVNTEQFKPLNKSKKDGHLLYIGRLETRKNVAGILKAIKDTSYHLDIIGNGEQKQELECFTRSNRLDVEFLGTVYNQQLPEIINRYPAAIFVSIYENSPKALLEAMSCGVAVIGTEVAGITELINHGYNGFLCKTDSFSIKQSIERILEDESLREELGQNARRYILENCDLNLIVKKETELYNNLVRI